MEVCFFAFFQPQPGKGESVMMYLSHIYGKGKSRYRFISNLSYCMKEMWKWKKTKIIFDNNSIRQEKAGFMKFLSAEMLNIKERSSHA